MNTASPASSQPIGLRGWWLATTSPVTAVTRMIVSKLTAAPTWVDAGVAARALATPRKASSATSTAASSATIIRGVRRQRRAVTGVMTGPWLTGR